MKKLYSKLCVITVLLLCVWQSSNAQITAPFTESFNTTTFPTTWSQSAITGGPWIVTGNMGWSASGITDHTGTSGSTRAWMDFSSTDVGVIMMSDTIDVSAIPNPEFSFWFNNNLGTHVVTPLNMVFVEAYDGTAWVEMDKLQQDNAGVWSEHYYDICGFLMPGNKFLVRFRAESGGHSDDYYHDLAIDDISVDTLRVNCFQPGGLKASNITSSSADLYWEAGCSDTAWDVEFGLVGFVKGTGTVTRTSVDSLSVSGLLPNTYYSFYTRSYCPSGDTSVWVGPFAFRTQCATLLSGTYTIDGGSPTSGTNFNSFADAVQLLNNCGISSSVVFNVKQGTYSEQVNLGLISGTSSTSTITFQADAANTSPVILTHGAVGTGDNYVLKLDGAEYVTVDSLEITATGSTYGYAVQFVKADYVTIKNCEINASSTSTSSSNIPIRNETGVNVEHCTIENNVLNNGYYGIYWYGGGSTSKEIGNVIRGNEINNYNYFGIMFYYQAGGTIEGNRVEQNTSAISTSYGMYIYYNDSVKVKANSVFLHGTGTNYGMYLNRATGSATNKCEIQNNMIVTSVYASGTSYGVYLYYGKYINLYHNSVNIRGGSASAGRALYVKGSSSSRYGFVDIKNNVFANSGPGQAAYLSSGAISSFLTGMDYNIFTAASGDILSQNGTIHTTLASWQSATSLDLNSFNTIPGFLSSTDLHLQGLAAADSGVNVGVMVDIDGEARPISPSTGYDIGADEYIPPTCPMGFGLTTLNIAATTTDVTWTVGANDTAWLFEYGAPGFTPGTGTVLHSSNDTATITGLTPVTDYCVYVRGICSAGDTSLYYGPYCFKTRCVSYLSGIYTINSAAATGGTNYASFADAMFALNNCGVSGPTTFHVKQGTYTEQVDIEAIVGTSSTNTVTFKADPTNTTPAILTYSASSSTDNYVVQFSGADNIIFDSLTIEPSGLTFGYGFRFMSADNCVVRNCSITCATNSSSQAVPIYNQSGTLNVTQNCTIENNILSKGYFGMYFYGSSSNKEIGNSILNNEIKDFYYYGLYFFYQGGGRVEGNVIEQLTAAPSSGYGMYAYYNDSLKVKANKITLTGSGTNYGMYMYRAIGSATNKCEIQNNMIITSPRSTGISYGMYIGYGKHINFYHNTIDVQGGSSTSGRALSLYGSTSSIYGNVNIRNNIFANDGAGEAMYIASGAISTFLDDMDNNIYYARSGNLINLNGTLHTTLASYVTASGLDSNSLAGQPGFNSSTDLHLNGFIAYDNGDSTTGVMTDIDGDVRPLSPSAGYDIGADEYILPNCPSAYGLYSDSVTTTTASFDWVNGPNDSLWEVEYGPIGFTPGSGTILSTPVDSIIVTGLTHSTCYDIYMRSICSYMDTSRWVGPVKFCTKCAPIADYCTSFETDAANGTPFCWNTYILTSSTGRIYTYPYSGNTGTKSVYMYNSRDPSAVMMLIAPEVSNLNAGTHRASFWARGDSTLIVGTMSDPADPGSFVPWDTVQGLSNSYQNYRVSFAGYTDTATYVAFLWDAANSNDYIYIDDYCWEEIPSCEKTPSVLILNSGEDSTSLNVGWNIDTNQVKYIVSYGPAGYDPVTNPAGGKDTTTTINFHTIKGLQPLTEYCVWTKSICSNGDTSFWSGPHCGSTGCPSYTSIPYFDDFSKYKYHSPIDTLPLCWHEATGALGVSNTVFTDVEKSRWYADGFSNNGFTGAAAMNLGTSTLCNEWIISPVFNLGTDTSIEKTVEFDVSLTQAYSSSAPLNGFGNDDTVSFVISYDDGVTWKKSNVLIQWDTSNVPSNTGDHITYTFKGASAQGTVRFGFYVKASVYNESVAFFVDNFEITAASYAGVEEVNFDAKHTIYPNPNRGVFTIFNKDNAHNSSVKLMDIQGRLIYDNQYYFSKNERKQVKINNLNSGVYFLLINTDGVIEQHKIIIE